MKCFVNVEISIKFQLENFPCFRLMKVDYRHQFEMIRINCFNGLRLTKFNKIYFSLSLSFVTIIRVVHPFSSLSLCISEIIIALLPGNLLKPPDIAIRVVCEGEPRGLEGFIISMWAESYCHKNIPNELKYPREPFRVIQQQRLEFTTE